MKTMIVLTFGAFVAGFGASEIISGTEFRVTGRQGRGGKGDEYIYWGGKGDEAEKGMSTFIEVLDISGRSHPRAPEPRPHSPGSNIRARGPSGRRRAALRAHRTSTASRATHGPCASHAPLPTTATPDARARTVPSPRSPRLSGRSALEARTEWWHGRPGRAEQTDETPVPPSPQFVLSGGLSRP